MPFSWFTADEAYGEHPGLREWLEDRGLGYVLAIPRNHHLDAAGGRMRADTLAAAVPDAAWARLSAGPGAKGQRVYEWALLATTSGAHQLLIRRSVADGELAYYRCHTPNGASLAELVTVAGSRWAVEECFQTAKNEAGLDHYQVRRYHAWHRHVTLALLAAAYLAITAASSTAPHAAHTPAPTWASEPEKGVPQVVDNTATPDLRTGQ